MALNYTTHHSQWSLVFSADRNHFSAKLFYVKYFHVFSREEKSLCHVTKVGKFLDDNRPKMSLKKWIRILSNFIDIIQFHLIYQMLAKVSGVESERTACKLRKKKEGSFMSRSCIDGYEMSKKQDAVGAYICFFLLFSLPSSLLFSLQDP